MASVIRTSGLGVVVIGVLTAGCAQHTAPDPGAPVGTSAEETGAVQPSDFDTSQLFQSDVDQAAELAQQRALKHLRSMMVKLYKRNPIYWRAHSESVQDAVNRVFGDEKLNLDAEDLNNQWAGDAVNLAFEPSFHGDRVRAFIIGLLQMLMASYNNETDFYITTDLDPQRLYNSARNFERAAWLLNTRRQANGEPFLIANSMAAGQINLSIERLFGKLIGGQDLLAQLTAEEQNRAIKNVVQSITTFFLPI